MPAGVCAPGCAAAPLQPEQSRSGDRLALGYLEGISLVLNRTKMEKLVLT